MTDEVDVPPLLGGGTGTSGSEPVDAIESATVLLVRDAADGLEVFMLERHLDADFAGGAYVFPGGKVEPADRTLPQDRWSGLDLAAESARMAAPEDLALGWYVATVREAFEEAGILLATVGGRAVTAEDLSGGSFQEARRRLASRDHRWDWVGWLRDHDLVLDLGALHWWSWWVTPERAPKRYETRFFVAAMPADQRGLHDRVETVASRWVTPGAALDAAGRGAVSIIYPTRKNLELLARFGSAGDAIAAARAGELDLRRHLPVIVRGDDGQPAVRHPFTGVVEAP